MLNSAKRFFLKHKEALYSFGIEPETRRILITIHSQFYKNTWLIFAQNLRTIPALAAKCN